MKKTQFIELVRIIKKTIVSFVSIVIFVMLTIGMFLGCSWSVEGFRDTVTNYVSSGNMYNAEFSYPYGFDDDYISELEKEENIDKAEGYYTCNNFFVVNDLKYQAKIISLTSDINTPTIIEGKLPKLVDEIAVEKYFANTHNIKIGDRIKIEKDDKSNILALNAIFNEDLQELQKPKENDVNVSSLKTDEFKVTALIEVPQYLDIFKVTYGINQTTSVPNDCIMFVDKEAFNTNAFIGYSNVVLINNDLFAMKSLTDEFDEHSRKFVDDVSNSLNEYVDNKNSKLVNAISTLEMNIKDEIIKGEQELEDGRNIIVFGQKQVAEGKKQLVESKKLLEDGQSQIDEKWNEVAKAKQEISKNEEKLYEMQKLFDATMKVSDLYVQLSNADEYIKTTTLINDIHYNYNVNKDVIEAELSNSYVFDLLDELWTNLNGGKYEDNFDQFVADYITLLYKINDNEGLEPINNIIINLKIIAEETKDESYTKLANDLELLFGDLVRYSSLPQLLNNKRLLDDGWKQLNDGKNKVAEATKEIDAAQNKINQSWIEYDEGLTLLSNKEKQLQDSIEKMKDEESTLSKAKKSLKEYQDMTFEITTYDGSVLGRDVNPALVTASMSLTIIGNIKYSIVLLFVLVGVFVSYTSISRLVYEGSKQIGTKKALGFHSREITITYLSYVLFATIVGSILGYIIARYIIETIIINGLSNNFIINDLYFYSNIKEVGLLFLFEFVTNTLAAYLACKNVLRKRAIALLNEQNETSNKRHFYEKTFFWKRLSLFSKTIINNFFNDGRRVLATLVGIVGCCALMTSPLLLSFDMNESLDYQLNKITTYDSIIYFDLNNEDCLKKLETKLDENNIEYCPTYYTIQYIKKNNGGHVVAYVFCSDNDNFNDFFHISQDGKDVEINDGIWLSQSFYDYNKFTEGGSVEFIDSQGNTHIEKCAGKFDFYAVRCQAVINKDTFEKNYDIDYFSNTITLKRKDKSVEEITNMLKDVDGFISVIDTKTETIDTCKAIMSSTRIVIIIFVSLAVALALLVLLNLLVMFVDEKKKELIVLMINGYSRKDARRYIYKDTIFLAIIGIILGCLIGTIVGMMTLRTFEGEAVSYIIKPSLKACVIAALATAGLTTFASLISLRRVNKISLTDYK